MNNHTEKSRICDTTNPFENNTAEQLMLLVTGLMRKSEENVEMWKCGNVEKWKGRACTMISGLLKALCHMRNNGEIILDGSTIRNHMPLYKIVELSQRTDLPDSATSEIRHYLEDLPGFTEEDAVTGKIQPQSYEVHGYLTMLLTGVMSDLSDMDDQMFSSPLRKP